LIKQLNLHEAIPNVLPGSTWWRG